MTEADGSLYDDDFYAWTQQQAELLRRGPAAANRLDYDLIAEEIEDLGERAARLPIALRAHHRAPAEDRVFGADRTGRSLAREITEWRVQFERKLTRSIIAKLDLPDDIAWRQTAALLSATCRG